MAALLPSDLSQTGKRGTLQFQNGPQRPDGLVPPGAGAGASPSAKEYLCRPGSIKQRTLKEVARLSYFENGPLQLAREFLEKQGIHLIVVPHLPKTYLDGAAMLMPDGTPVIGLTLRHDRVDNFWFTLLHELAHVARHLNKTERIIVDDLDLRRHDALSGEDKVEKEADEMAREGLIPGKAWEKSLAIKGELSGAEEVTSPGRTTENRSCHPCRENSV